MEKRWVRTWLQGWAVSHWPAVVLTSSSTERASMLLLCLRMHSREQEGEKDNAACQLHFRRQSIAVHPAACVAWPVHCIPNRKQSEKKKKKNQRHWRKNTKSQASILFI